MKIFGLNNLDEIIKNKNTLLLANAGDRCANPVFHILNSTCHGNFMIASYDFECVEENKLMLLKSKKTTYFSKNKVSRIIIDYEIYRTNNYQ